MALLSTLLLSVGNVADTALGYASTLDLSITAALVLVTIISSLWLYIRRNEACIRIRHPLLVITAIGTQVSVVALLPFASDCRIRVVALLVLAPLSCELLLLRLLMLHYRLAMSKAKRAVFSGTPATDLKRRDRFFLANQHMFSSSQMIAMVGICVVAHALVALAVVFTRGGNLDASTTCSGSAVWQPAAIVTGSVVVACNVLVAVAVIKLGGRLVDGWKIGVELRALSTMFLPISATIAIILTGVWNWAWLTLLLLLMTFCNVLFAFIRPIRQSYRERRRDTKALSITMAAVLDNRVARAKFLRQLELEWLPEGIYFETAIRQLKDKHDPHRVLSKESTTFGTTAITTPAGVASTDDDISLSSAMVLVRDSIDIYNKYIQVDSPLHIDIPDAAAALLYVRFAAGDISYTMFDDAWEHVEVSLREPFVRFLHAQDIRILFQFLSDEEP